MNYRSLKKELDRKLKILLQAGKVAEANRLKKALVKATPVDTGEARDGWTVTEQGVVNKVPHISFLNEGSSSQAPSHFVEKQILEGNFKVDGVPIIYEER